MKTNQNNSSPKGLLLLMLLGVLLALLPHQLYAAPTGESLAPTAANGWDARFGMPGVEGAITAMTVAPNGDLYVGGEFAKAGGIDAQHIARWDGDS